VTQHGFGSPVLAPLRAAPLLRKLSIVIKKLGGAPAVTAADGHALAAAALPELHELRLDSIGPGLVAALAAAPWLRQIESLELRATAGREGPARGLAAADGRALAAARLPSIKRLVLTNMQRGFVAACAAAAWLPHLERVELWGESGLLGVGRGVPRGSPAWAAAPFTALVSLTLSRGGTATPSEASRLAALVAAPWFGRLRDLELGGWPLGTHGGGDGAGLRALAAAPFPHLTSLSLSSASLSAADVSGVLSSAPWLSGLTRLALSFNHIGAPGHRALSLLPLPRLRTLSLECNLLDGTGLAALVSAPWLTQLAKLTLEETVFTSPQSCENMAVAIDDDAWVFGRLRRLGCVVEARLVEHASDSSSSDDEGDPGSDPDDD
jgi:hypothetical protein